MQAFPTTALGTWLATFALSLVCGVVPLFSPEAFVFALSAGSPQAEALPVALAASLGQMTAKSLVYLAGRGVVKLPLRSNRDRIGAVTARLAGAERAAMALVLMSAATSMPPFYAVSVAAGALRLPFGGFFVLGWAGAFLRFTLVFALPRLLP